MEQDFSAERAAQNDATFRESNERIEDVAEQYGLRGKIPFICECAEPTCVEIIRLTPAAYEEVRSKPVWFAVAPGHEESDGRHSEVVRQEEGYVIVTKVGEAAEIAAALDPRSPSR
jgi:hypothetical protein